LHVCTKPIKVHAKPAVAPDTGPFRDGAFFAVKAALGAEIFSLRRKELPELFHLKAQNRPFKATTQMAHALHH